jgi:ABC-type transport system involved in cytochrome c biogenesis ATPase subunit
VNNKSGVVPSSYPAFILKIDNWDDYSTKCQFYLTYASSKTKSNDIGNIKILHKKKSRTVLDDDFELLGDEYISLGQSLDFYENLLKICGQDVAVDFLESVRDISWQPLLAEPFETLSPFRNAMLRNNSAQKARRFGRVIINSQKVLESFSFTYKCQIDGADNEIEVAFDFDTDDPVPRRIVGIIGRNATGKTRFLSQLSQDLVKIRRTSLETEKQREESFAPQRPIFNRLLALSFSAFDRFARPQSEQVSYVYCGIRNEKGALSRKDLELKYQSNLVRIKNAGRAYEWAEHMEEILGDAGKEVKKEILQGFVESEDKKDTLELLSSGQAILAHAITSLIAWIEPESIIIFDEPETHLHPNAVASLFNVLHKILRHYDSYSIVATHSPVVIQEVPSKRVILFEREGNTTIVKKLGIETFGENVAELTRHVFDTVEIPSFYKAELKRLSRSRDFEAVMTLFENNLSMSAQSYLLSQYARDNSENT